MTHIIHKKATKGGAVFWGFPRSLYAPFARVAFPPRYKYRSASRLPRFPSYIVYPQSNLNKRGEAKISFALSNVQSSSEMRNRLELRSGEFKLAGLWQYPPKCNTPCITIRRNWEQGLVNYLEKVDSKQKAYILRPNNLPVDWSDSPTEAFRWSEEAGAEGQKPDFVSVKAAFVAEVNKFQVVEVLAPPSQTRPKYLKT